MEYVNLAAVLWLTFYIVSTMCMVNNNVGRKLERVNALPLVISIAALITLGIAIVGDLNP